MGKSVLLVVNGDNFKETLEVFFNSSELIFSNNLTDVTNLIKSVVPDVVILDMESSVVDSFGALRAVKESGEKIGVVGISGDPNAMGALKALDVWTYGYIKKPFGTGELISTVSNCLGRVRAKKELYRIKGELTKQFGISDIISRNPAMLKVFELVKKVSPSSSSVLITGESGTGKELIAKAIHNSSPRKNYPFIAVNSAAIPRDLVESELFGYEKGAFTGATSTKVGKFECADRGTIFLDEVGAIPVETQAKLLRVLQEKSFERVGGNKLRHVDIRVVAATNSNLESAVKRGGFRQDLYYRLKVVPLELPPLRERKDDIPILVDAFVERQSKACDKLIAGVAKSAMHILLKSDWPGNVRELENLVERLVLVAKDGCEIKDTDLPSDIAGGFEDPLTDVRAQHHFGHSGFGCCEGDAVQSGAGRASGDYREAMRDFERNYIINVLEKTNWNRVMAAGLMKVHRNTLLYKMKELGIKRALLKKDVV